MKTSWINIGIILMMTIGIVTCQSKKSLAPGEGYIEVNGGKVWYRIDGQGDKTPVLLLHGGPGAPSYYLNPLKELSHDRPVIFFDQLGCGRSDRTIDQSLMTVDAHVEQLEQVRKALGLDEFYLYGQSWGTMLGTDYYLKYPTGIKALILSSPCLNSHMWKSDADTLLATLPDSVQATIRTNEMNRTYTSPEYQEAVNIYYENFLARKVPWSADIDSSFAQFNTDVYEHMWGPSEFTVTGTLQDYDRTDRLGEIKVPTLFICGEYDEARPSTVKYYQSLVSNSRFALINDAAHLTMQDNPQQDIQVIGDFLSEMDGK